MPEKELEGLRRETEKLADHLIALDGELDVDTDTFASILRSLLEGQMATSIIKDYGLVSDDEPGV